MSENDSSPGEVDKSVVQDNGEIWAIDKRELGQKISEYYGVDGVRFVQEHITDGGVAHYDAIVIGIDREETLVESGLFPLSHSESGAIGVVADELPPVEAVREADSETEEVCHWCGEEFGDDPVLWDVQEEGNPDVHYRYGFCSEDCRESGKWAELGDETHTEPERLRVDEMEDIHR